MNKFLLTATVIATIFAASPLLAMTDRDRDLNLNRAEPPIAAEALRAALPFDPELRDQNDLYTHHLQNHIKNYPYGNRWIDIVYKPTNSEQEIEQYLNIKQKFLLEEKHRFHLSTEIDSRWDSLGNTLRPMDEDIIEVCVFQAMKNVLANSVPRAYRFLPVPFPHINKSPILSEQDRNELDGLEYEDLIHHMFALEEELSSHPHLSNPHLSKMPQESAEVVNLCQKAMASYRKLYSFADTQAIILVRMAHMYKILGKAEGWAPDDNIIACYDFADRKGHPTAAFELAEYFDIVMRDQFKAFQWYTIASDKAQTDGIKQEIDARIAVILEELDERVESIKAMLKK